MRVLIHDYAGHPFQVQLSRALAERGHTVLHIYCESRIGPRGNLQKSPKDPETLSIEPIRLKRPIDKHSLLKRRLSEIDYGRGVLEVYRRFKPGVVISANSPLDAQSVLQKACRGDGVRFVFWLQDLIGTGAYRVLKGRYLGLGSLMGKHWMRLEAKLLRRSDRVILITEDHKPTMTQMGVDPSRVCVIENWAPLEDFPVLPKDNVWAREHGVNRKFCFMYSGTLGMKHDPRVLLELAQHFQDYDDVQVVVISEDRGAEWLRRQKEEKKIESLSVLGFQPIGRLPEVHASADVLMAILEPDAGVFSVPSKVLTYHCAARPVLLAVPADNLAARIVGKQQSGLVVAPGDREGFIQAAVRLMEDRPLWERCAANARRYAEAHFDIRSITDQFERMIGGG